MLRILAVVCEGCRSVKLSAQLLPLSAMDLEVYRVNVITSFGGSGINSSKLYWNVGWVLERVWLNNQMGP